MSVFVDKDQSGRISLMEMSYGEAEVLLQALRFYFESRWLHTIYYLYSVKSRFISYY